MDTLLDRRAVSWPTSRPSTATGTPSATHRTLWIATLRVDGSAEPTLMCDTWAELEERMKNPCAWNQVLLWRCQAPTGPPDLADLTHVPRACTSASLTPPAQETT